VEDVLIYLDISGVKTLRDVNFSPILNILYQLGLELQLQINWGKVAKIKFSTTSNHILMIPFLLTTSHSNAPMDAKKEFKLRKLSRDLKRHNASQILSLMMIVNWKNLIAKDMLFLPVELLNLHYVMLDYMANINAWKA
jgi:hypothetical protein